MVKHCTANVSRVPVAVCDWNAQPETTCGNVELLVQPPAEHSPRVSVFTCSTLVL